MRYENLRFFDKTGSPTNFDYDEVNEKWTGRINMPRTSIGLHQVAHLYLLEEFLNTTGDVVYAKPHINDSAGPNVEVSAEWKELDEKSFFLFQFDSNEEKPTVQKITKALDIKFDQDATETILSGTTIKTTTILTSEIIQLNIAFMSLNDDAYERTLILRDKNDGLPLLEVTFYCEAVGEDERLRVVTENLGYKILPQDNPIFRKTRVEEAGIDFINLNQKRKEILLEGHNIKPFTGTYKGLINAIKYYGYSDLTLKEYWKNVDVNSTQFGKYKHTKVIDIFDSNVDFNDQGFIMPNKNYRKTSLFGLFYRMNRVVEGALDKYDLPITEEVFQYSIEEALIKLFGLKEKLKDEYLPLNARIIDIVCEADYFGKQGITVSLGQNETNTINVGINPDFYVTPSENGYIEDLRDIADLELVTSVPSDLPLNTNDFTVSELRDIWLAYFERYSPNLNSIAQLPDKPGIPVGYPAMLINDSFDAKWDNMDVLWNSIETGVSHVFDFEASDIQAGDQFIITDTVSGDFITYTATVGTQTDVANGLKAAWDAKLPGLPWARFLTSIEDTGTGIVMRAKGVGTGASLLDFNFVPSTVNGGGPNDQELKKEIITLGGLYTWDNVLRGDFYEIEWIITKPEDETPAFEQITRGPIADYEDLPIILPYVGTYTVEMRLYDLYNQLSTELKWNYITVESREVEFVGYYRAREAEYTWDNREDAHTWNEYNSFWDLPLKPNYNMEELDSSWYESLDRANAIMEGINTDNPNFQIMRFNNLGEIVHPGPYYWNNLEEGSWNDTYHLTWDFTKVSADTPAHFDIQIVQATGGITITTTNGIGVHTFGSSDMSIAANELNTSNDPIIKKYIYNPVYDIWGDVQYIHAVARKTSRTHDFISVDGTPGAIIITNDQNTVINNVTYNEAIPLKQGKVLPRLTHISFTYDETKIPSKDKPIWTIENADDSTGTVIEYQGRWMNYLFKDTGRYYIGLTLTDNNGNVKSKTKNLVIIE